MGELQRPITRQPLTEHEMRAQLARLAWPHYVYALCETDGAIFYIGKGYGDRAFDHALEARRGGASPKCQYIRHLGDRVRYAVLLACRDDAFALGFEAAQLLHHRGTLLNLQPPRLSAIERMFDPADERVETLLLLLDVFRQIGEMERACDEAEWSLAGEAA